MPQWMNRFLSALGLRGKAEADVSYDPALDDGGSAGAGGSDLKGQPEDLPRH